MQLIKECVWLPAEVSEQAEWIDDPYILPKKSKNQTCNMFLADMTPHIFISQILRWKTQFPEAFSDPDSRLSLCTYYSGTYKRNYSMPNPIYGPYMGTPNIWVHLGRNDLFLEIGLRGR